MIEITPAATAYFRHLIEQQDEAGLGLRLSVENPGTPAAGCDLQFCPEGGHGAGDHTLSLDGFDFHIEAGSLKWLENAEIDFQEDPTGGQLSIRAPGIKGNAPAEDAPLNQKVQWVLDTEVNPMLASHGGNVALVEATPDGKVVLQFGGGCQGCGMADVTLKQGISRTLHERLSDVKEVVDVTDHESGDNPYYSRDEQGQSVL